MARERFMGGLSDCVGKTPIGGVLPEAATIFDHERLFELQALIIAALGLADTLKLSMVGIHLDQARVELGQALERHQLHGVVLTVPPGGG